MKRITILILTIILFFGVIVRLYQFRSPVADWHSWRQVDTAAVTRNFVQNGIDLLHPKYDDLSNVASGINNPQGYRFVEFPLYNAFTAILFTSLDYFTLEEWSRLVTIAAQIISAIFLFCLVRHYRGDVVGLLTAFFFVFLPFNIYYGRSILPGPTMIMFVLGGIYFFHRWITVQLTNIQEEKNIQIKWEFFFGIIFIACALLVRPYAVFYLLPIGYIIWKYLGLKGFFNPYIIIFLFTSFVPFIAWRIWMTQYPEGIPGSDWLLNKGNIRFKGSFFYWLFAERIGRLILGYWGVILLTLGIVRKTGKEKLFFFSFLVATLLYMTVIARGNVQHDYYQIAIIPTLAIFLALGTDILVRGANSVFSPLLSKIVLLVVFCFMFSFSWYYVRDYYNVNNVWVNAGDAVDRLTPKNAKILTLTDGDTTLLYYANRKGWANLQKSFPEMIKMGARYLIIPTPSESELNLGQLYPIISSSNDYALFDLQPTK